MVVIGSGVQMIEPHGAYIERIGLRSPGFDIFLAILISFIGLYFTAVKNRPKEYHNLIMAEILSTRCDR